jgi:vancomycin resistance protein YoaR
LNATVDAAFGVARSGNPLSDGIVRLQVLTHPTTLADPVVIQDAAAVDRLAASIATQFDRPPADASVTYDASGGFEATPAVVGLTVDGDALRQSVQAVLAQPTAGDAALAVPALRAEPAVTTEEADAAAVEARRMTSEALTLTGGPKAIGINEAKLAALISFGLLADGEWGTLVDAEAVTELLRPLVARVASQPRDASFTFDANGVSGVVPGQAGRRLKLKPSVASVMGALSARAAGSSVPSAALAVGVAQPLLSTEQARAAAPKMRRISSWTTYYVPGEGNFWNANIHIPARDLDGMVVAPGEWFDFWQDIGPVTVERGYGYGGVIIGGRSVANGALAGGICSTSTTLFNAAMRAGLEIGQRVNHSYYIERYPVGLDATVLKTDTYTTSMQFRNDTDDPVVIRSYTGNGLVRFDLWGIPNGRTVTLSAPVTSNHRTAIETTVVNPNLAPGTAIRREYMHNGFDASVTRWVRDADGNLIHEDTWFSHYNTVNGVTEVGPRRSS